jgi:Ca2+-binding EF-hand superfamily protein
MKAPMGEEAKRIRMAMSIQQRIKKQMTAPDAFKALDSKKVSILTVRDFQVSLPQHFGLSLKRADVMTFFQMIDKDNDGILLYKEFEDFYQHDFSADIERLEAKRNTFDIQIEVFEHLTKVLKQKNLTLEEAFS